MRSDSLLHELLLQRLPSKVLASANSSMDLDKLADMADKVMEASALTVAAASDARSDHTGPSESSNSGKRLHN